MPRRRNPRYPTTTKTSKSPFSSLFAALICLDSSSSSDESNSPNRRRGVFAGMPALVHYPLTQSEKLIRTEESTRNLISKSSESELMHIEALLCADREKTHLMNRSLFFLALARLQNQEIAERKQITSESEEDMKAISHDDEFDFASFSPSNLFRPAPPAQSTGLLSRLTLGLL